MVGGQQMPVQQPEDAQPLVGPGVSSRVALWHKGFMHVCSDTSSSMCRLTFMCISCSNEYKLVMHVTRRPEDGAVRWATWQPGAVANPPTTFT